jgi:hypothetical protein
MSDDRYSIEEYYMDYIKMALDKHAGKFVDDQGNVVPNPDPNQPFVVVASPWEDMHKVGARQEKCSKCQRFVGIAPPTQEMIDSGRRVDAILCTDCWQLLELINRIRQ